MERYLFAVLREAQLRKHEINEPLETVYISGGTPSLIPAELFCSFLSELKTILDFSRVHEFTTEANPGTVTPAWLDTAVSQGINRISFGVQAFQDQILQTLFMDLQKTIQVRDQQYTPIVLPSPACFQVFKKIQRFLCLITGNNICNLRSIPKEVVSVIIIKQIDLILLRSTAEKLEQEIPQVQFSDRAVGTEDDHRYIIVKRIRKQLSLTSLESIRNTEDHSVICSHLSFVNTVYRRQPQRKHLIIDLSIHRYDLIAGSCKKRFYIWRLVR